MLEGRPAGLARMLQPGLYLELVERHGAQATQRPLVLSQCLHRANARGLEFLDLPTRDIGNVEQAVLGFPHALAMVRPSAQAAVRAGDRSCCRGVLHEGLQPCARCAGVMGVVGQAQRLAPTVAKHHMRELRRPPLNIGDQVRVQDELQNMLWMDASLELGVRHFVAEISQIRRPVDALNEVRPPAPMAPDQSSLVDDLRALGHRFTCCSRSSLKIP